MRCIQCQSDMTEDCRVTVEGDLNGVKISKKGKGLFNTAKAKLKAAVCTTCGYVSFYVEDYKNFKQREE